MMVRGLLPGCLVVCACGIALAQDAVAPVHVDPDGADAPALTAPAPAPADAASDFLPADIAPAPERLPEQAAPEVVTGAIPQAGTRQVDAGMPADAVTTPMPDPVAAPAPADTTAGDAAPVAVIPPPAAPVDDDHVRDLLILVSACVLVVTLALIIWLLVKRGREAQQGARRYVAEAYLRDISGSTSQSLYRLGSKPVMLGRVGGKDTEFLDYIVVPSATVGRRHALIEFKDFGYWIMDQGSINGTFVNGRPVSAEMRLKHGDRIRLHKLEFEFVMPEVGDSSATVLAADAPRAAQAAQAVATAASAPDFVLDLEPEPEPAPKEPVSAADEMEALRRSVESEEATLLPSGPGARAPVSAPDDETLMPASGSGSSTGAGDDETLLPGSGGAARGEPRSGKEAPKKGDEFFDITGGD